MANSLCAFETKTWEPIDVPFPTELVPHLERYLSKYRLLLMAERCRGDRLWISYRFAPQAPHTLGINTPGAPSALSVGQ